MIKNYLTDELKNKEYISLEDIYIPDGIEITINDILNMKDASPITLDKNNVLQDGIINYLLAVKNAEENVSVRRTNKLQKLKISLPSVA